MKLTKRIGDISIYSDGTNDIEITRCLNPNVYFNTRYYITFCNLPLSKEIMKKSYSSGIMAAMAAKYFSLKL